MKNIPPKFFYKFSKEEQEIHAVEQMNKHYTIAEEWKKLAQKARNKHIPEPDERPDEMKHEG